jgi:hypothetical protein
MNTFFAESNNIYHVDITFLANKTYWTAGLSPSKPENFAWCSASMEDVDLSGINWMKDQPQFKENSCLRVFFPFIDRKIGKITPPPPSTQTHK